MLLTTFSEFCCWMHSVKRLTFIREPVKYFKVEEVLNRVIISQPSRGELQHLDSSSAPEDEPNKQFSEKHQLP